MINAGELDKRITLQAPTVTRGSDGSEIIVYTDIATVWASYLVQGGKEFYYAQKINAETTAVFKIRHRANLNTRYRIYYNKRYFYVLSIDDSVSDELKLACKEVI